MKLSNVFVELNFKYSTTIYTSQIKLATTVSSGMAPPTSPGPPPMGGFRLGCQ